MELAKPGDDRDFRRWILVRGICHSCKWLKHILIVILITPISSAFFWIWGLRRILRKYSLHFSTYFLTIQFSHVDVMCNVYNEDDPVIVLITQNSWVFLKFSFFFFFSFTSYYLYALINLDYIGILKTFSRKAFAVMALTMCIIH